MIYDAVYTTDQFGRRVSSIEKGRAESHLLLFGCSYLFGVGVNDWESIPHYLAMQLPSFELSTYAIPAGSMSNMLAGLTTLPMREQEIKEEGALVYLMFPEIHARRVAGYLANPTYGFYNPKYRLKNGKLELEGSFLDADPWLSGLWMWAAKKSVLARELFVRMERGIHEEDYALAKQIVLESRDKYLSLFPNGRFIVATMERENELTQSLQAEGVEFIFLQDIMSLSRDDKFFIKGDGHFSAAGNLAIAEDLSKKLQAHLKKKQ